MRASNCLFFISMIKSSGLLLPLLLALLANRASGATFLGFNTGPFYSIVDTTDAPTIPTALQVLFDGPVPNDTFISITSSDPARMIISGGGVTIMTGQSSAIVLVSSFIQGNVTVTGAFQATFATNTVSVVAEVPIIPSFNIELVAGAAPLSWTPNATDYQLETNNVLTNPTGWGVLTSTYSILNTNFVVTNAISDAARFYRLHKP